MGPVPVPKPPAAAAPRAALQSGVAEPPWAPVFGEPGKRAARRVQTKTEKKKQNKTLEMLVISSRGLFSFGFLGQMSSSRAHENGGAQIHVSLV